MPMPEDQQMAPAAKAPVVRDEAYAAQREELTTLLKSCAAKNEPLRAYDKRVLTPDDISTVLHKLRHNLAFSRKERAALSEAGFDVEQMYPDL
jgi:hypothetical protein